MVAELEKALGATGTELTVTHKVNSSKAEQSNSSRPRRNSSGQWLVVVPMARVAAHCALEFSDQSLERFGGAGTAEPRSVPSHIPRSADFATLGSGLLIDQLALLADHGDPLFGYTQYLRRDIQPRW